MPTSVLLAVLAAAGLLALAPALVRRYDATERLVAERASPTARVLSRRRRRRTVPGRRPIRGARAVLPPLRPEVPVSAPPVSAPPVSAPPTSRRAPRLRAVPPGVMARPARRRPLRRHPTAVYRRRRVLAALLLLNLVELIGVFLVGPGFWVGVAVTGTLLLVYLGHLRSRALAERARRRRMARRAAWLAARQAEVRAEQARRAEARREQQRRLAAQREAVRRAAMGLDRPADLPPAATGSVSYRRAGGLRGSPYETRRSNTA
ncbi:hypothetical protein GCM10009687_81540 [Asanoa iriomotensis]|uniref:Integral membrane protein n=1 Tax=Asanoa iriomotensis TaxID=234613 RepID=A0ABQ4BXV5_9ACTN|nr:hypothetical protein Air01nite_14620 [Asanoa iriomotensis]